jgi:hypothetical protein
MLELKRSTCSCGCCGSWVFSKNCSLHRAGPQRSITRPNGLLYIPVPAMVDDEFPFYTARTGTLGWKRVLESSVAEGTSATGSQITHQQIQKVTLKIPKFLPLVKHKHTTTTSATVEPNSRERNYQIIGSWTMMIQTTTTIIIIITMIMIMPKTI